MIEKDDGEVNEEEEKVAREFAEAGLENADDPHIIALARLSGARLLISKDRKSGLHAIFKDRRSSSLRARSIKTPSTCHCSGKRRSASDIFATPTKVTRNHAPMRLCIVEKTVILYLLSSSLPVDIFRCPPGATPLCRAY